MNWRIQIAVETKNVELLVIFILIRLSARNLNDCVYFIRRSITNRQGEIICHMNTERGPQLRLYCGNQSVGWAFCPLASSIVAWQAASYRAVGNACRRRSSIGLPQRTQ